MGDSVPETFVNITRVDYDFDDEAFDHVSEDAKDFISKLLMHRKEDRMTADECLNFCWLTVDNEEANNNRICTDKLKKFIIRRKWQVRCVVFFVFVFIRCFSMTLIRFSTSLHAFSKFSNFFFLSND